MNQGLERRLMTSKEPKVETIDIYDGEIIAVWKDEDCVFLSFPWVTLNFPLKGFPVIVKDLVALGKAWKKMK